MKEAWWQNDILLAMGSSFCNGLGLGIYALSLFVSHEWVLVPLVVCIALFSAGMLLLKRAEKLRIARWERREWR